ncbi:MAG: MauE/DoxX family redox-associated membrane protein [Planctomycetota bacterium]
MSAERRPGFGRRLDRSGIPLLLARLGVGGMFAYLAIMKIRDPIEFLKQIREYGILPTEPPIFLNLTAVALPYLELLCAALLLIGLWRRGAALVLSGMLAFFTPMLLWRALGIYAGGGVGSFCDIKFDCGCGTGEVYICRKLAENLALQVGALIALLSASHRFCLSALFGRRPPAAKPPRP